MVKEDFDKIGCRTLNNLIEVFNVDEYTAYGNEIQCPYSIGIEIEVKFKYFFPELYEKYFKNNYYQENLEQRSWIDTIITNDEKDLVSKLEKVVELGIPKGNDKYWEFSFNPVYNLQLIINKINVLKKVGLIPSGKHSLHINIGGLSLCKDVYWVLLILEALFVDKDRIVNGLNQKTKISSDTWGKKGIGGIMVKNNYLLTDESIGLELRTLYIDDNTDALNLFMVLNYFLTKIKNGEDIDVIDEVKEFCKLKGLQDRNFGKPHLNKEIWGQYVDKFDEISNFVKTKIHGKINF